MLSIITCSVSPERLQAFKENIAATIGIPYEIIAFDNRQKGFGLTKVYNLCAREARYSYLCFIHEDICFETENWGSVICEKLSEEETGVIGFAGSTSKLKALSGWRAVPEHSRRSMTQHSKASDGTTISKKIRLNPENEIYSQVIVLDGFCLFVRKDVWEKCPFDEETFRNFHLYDLDFTFHVSTYKKNYVCHCIDIVHFSDGNYSEEWLKDTYVFHQKWESQLPRYVDKPSAIMMRQYEKYGSRHFVTFTYNKLRNKKPAKELFYAHIRQYPLYRKNLKLYYLYLRAILPNRTTLRENLLNFRYNVSVFAAQQRMRFRFK